MINEEFLKNLMNLYNNPLFKQDFFSFFMKAQQEGVEAAKKFWGLGHRDDSLKTPELFEKLMDFYIVLGFIPRSKHDEVLKENERLREENGFLKETIRELQVSVFKEGGKITQEAWQEIMDKQFEMHKEMAKNFFDLFKQTKGTST